MKSRFPLLRFIADVYSRLGWRFGALLFLGAITAATDGLRIGLALLLIPLLGIEVDNPLDRIVRTLFGALGVEYSLAPVAAFAGLAFLIQAAIAMVFAWYQAGYANYYVFLWRQSLLARYADARWRYFLDTPVGQLNNALSSESVRLQMAVSNGFAALSNAMVALVFVGAAFIAGSTSATLLILLSSAALAANFILAGRIVRRSRAVTKGGAVMMQVANDFLRNIKTIKAAGDRSNIERVFVTNLRRLMNNTRRANFMTNYSRVVSEFVILLAVVTVVAVSLTLDIGEPPAQMLLVLLLFFRAMTRAAAAMLSVQKVNANLGAFESLQSTLRTAADAAESAPGATALTRPLTVGDFHKGIIFESVSIHHEKLPALERVSLTIRKGSTTAIVGPSGAGKTTLVDAILRLYDPDEGRILIDNRPLADFDLRSWRSAIGYVSQDTTLLNDTILENIRLLKPDASEEEVIGAARVASAHDFISATPQGYHTNIGDMGLKLSGGQRQRLSLARAMLCRPQILILDEATSALDSATEEQVMMAIKAYDRRQTVIHIAHRLSTVRHADVVHVLHEGQLVESGDWDSLISRRGLFYDLWQRQLRTAS